MSRSKRNIKPKPLILFLVEGETEKSFFNKLSQNYRLTSAKTIKILNNSGSNWIEKAKLMIQNDNKLQINQDTKIFIIFDKNNDSDNKIQEMLTAGNKLNINGSSCKVGFSNSCFEVWLLAHYERVTCSLTKDSELYKKLSNYLNADYKKGNPKQMAKIVSNNKVFNAIQNSKEIKRFSSGYQSTNIGEIVNDIIDDVR